MIHQYHHKALKLAATCTRRQILARGMATANSVVSGRKFHLSPSPTAHHDQLKPAVSFSLSDDQRGIQGGDNNL